MSAPQSHNEMYNVFELPGTDISKYRYSIKAWHVYSHNLYILYQLPTGVSLEPLVLSTPKCRNRQHILLPDCPACTCCCCGSGSCPSRYMLMLGAICSNCQCC